MNSDESTDSSSNFPQELLSNSMITFMVRGLFSNLEFPYAYFPSRNFTGICCLSHFGKLLTDWKEVDFM